MLSFETIVAPATPPGEGGVGIIRLSGSSAVACLERVFHGRTPVTTMSSHRLYHGHLCSSAGTRIDEVLAVIMRAPGSYTGEDVVEVHCHGGNQVMRSILNLFLDNGVRMARPGEFTQRAFLNGRLDLAQAEAVVEIIWARSERASKVALDQLDGHLSQVIHRFADVFRSALVLLEAHIDFPDDEVGSLDLPALLGPLQDTVKEMQLLADSFDLGRALREGISVIILGRPNVGKSSLMNALLGESRAIVTEVAGTTRDTLEEQLVLAGFPLRLVDAAGVRDTTDPVEKEGVRRAREKALAADLILMVVDGSVSLRKEDRMALDLCQPDKTLVVINKSDQPQVCTAEEFSPFNRHVLVSAKHGAGLSELRSSIVDIISTDAAHVADEGLIINERRHRDALLQAITSVGHLFASVQAGAPLECLALELREGLSSLGQITGETTPDELLDQIFSQFCIGK